MSDPRQYFACFVPKSSVKKDNQLKLTVPAGGSFTIYGTTDGYFLRFNNSPNTAIKDMADSLLRLEIPLPPDQQVFILQQVITEFQESAVGFAAHVDAVTEGSIAAADAIKATITNNDDAPGYTTDDDDKSDNDAISSSENAYQVDYDSDDTAEEDYALSQQVSGIRF